MTLTATCARDGFVTVVEVDYMRARAAFEKGLREFDKESVRLAELAKVMAEFEADREKEELAASLKEDELRQAEWAKWKALKNSPKGFLLRLIGCMPQSPWRPSWNKHCPSISLAKYYFGLVSKLRFPYQQRLDIAQAATKNYLMREEDVHFMILCESPNQSHLHEVWWLTYGLEESVAKLRESRKEAP